MEGQGLGHVAEPLFGDAQLPCQSRLEIPVLALGDRREHHPRAAETGLVTLRPDAGGALARANNEPVAPGGQVQPRPREVIEGLREKATIIADGDTPDDGTADGGYPGASIIPAAAPEE